MANVELMTQQTLITASAKLPDDLRFDEYVSLLNSVLSLSDSALDRASRSDLSREDRSELPRVPDVLRVRYGSDFEVVLGIATASATAAIAVSAAFLGFAKALKMLADAGVRNEDRLKARDKRLRRREERKRALKSLAEGPATPAGAQPGATQYQGYILSEPIGLGVLKGETHSQSRARARNLILPPELRQAIENETGVSTLGLHVFMSDLAEYGIQVEVSEQ